MTTLAIVYDSGYGHTEVVAKDVQTGASGVPGVTVKLYKAKEAIEKMDELDSADGIIFGAPTYMGSASAGMKAFMDASSKSWFAQKWKNKIAAGFSNSGSLHGDKLNTLVSFAILAAQHSMIWVGTGMMPPSKSEGHGGRPEDVNRVGSSLGLMTQSDNASPEHTPSSGDRETARLFGQRVAEVTKKWAGA